MSEKALAELTEDARRAGADSFGKLLEQALGKIRAGEYDHDPDKRLVKMFLDGYHSRKGL